MLARDLLGRRLVRVAEQGEALVGRIVEVEAYLGFPDRAAHTFNGRRTARNQSMYLDGGHAYVYFTYGLHHCLNIVAQAPEQPTACLIRALEPIQGLETMRRHRAGKIPYHRLRDRDLCSGPAKLCQAMEIDRELDGADLTADTRLYLADAPAVQADRILAGPRIGVAYAGEWADKPLRFYEAQNLHLSAK